MKKKISIIIILLLSLSVSATTLNIYPEGEDATGFIFNSEEFTSENNADIYAKEVEAEESSGFYFFSNVPAIKHKGKENIDEFRCDELDEEDYELTEEIIEKHGYCILTHDRNKIIKIYVSTVSEQGKTVTIDWGEHEDIVTEEEEAEENEEPYAEETAEDKRKEEGEEAPEIIIIEEPDEVEDTKEENKEEKKNNLTDIIRNMFNKVRNNPIFLGLIIMLIIYSILNMVLAETRKRWKEKNKK